MNKSIIAISMCAALSFFTVSNVFAEGHANVQNMENFDPNYDTSRRPASDAKNLNGKVTQVCDKVTDARKVNGGYIINLGRGNTLSVLVPKSMLRGNFRDLVGKKVCSTGMIEVRDNQTYMGAPTAFSIE